MSGKGSAPRPFDVDRQTYESNWDRIFKRDTTTSTGNSGSLHKDVAVQSSDAGADERDRRSVQDSEAKGS